MGSLSEWARSSKIVLSDGIELKEDALGDWSLSTTTSIKQGNPILTVPSQVILTSDINGDSYLPYYSETDMHNVCVWMESELEMGSQSKQDYLPEYMLVYKLMREVYLDKSSWWYAWWKSLPTKFSTGIYLDEVERNHVERMTGEYIRVQGSQYQACLNLFQKLVSSQGTNGNEPLIPIEFYQWMLDLQQNSNDEDFDFDFDNLVKWAFTVVFTRSWRSPDRKHAQIVPLGDLANHDSQLANLKPSFRQADGAFQFFVTDDIDAAGPKCPKLYLSYGLTYAPARYLVLFGFCDVTAGYIDAQLDFLQDNDSSKWPTDIEPSQLVVSTLNGALSEEVWIAFLYKVLQENEPEALTRIRKAFGDYGDYDDYDQEGGDQYLEQVLETWEWTVGMEIIAYYQRLLETDFAPIIVTEKDLAEHPNLSMIVNYNLFIRETYLNVLEHVNLFLTQCKEFQEMTASNGNSEVETTETATSISDQSSILRFQNYSPEGLIRPAGSSKNDTMSQISPNASLRPMGESVSAQLVSSESTYTESTYIKRDQNPSDLRSARSNFGTSDSDPQSNSIGQTSQERIDSTATPNLSTVNSDPQSYSLNQKTQESNDSTATPKFPYGKSDSNSVDQSSQERIDSTGTPKFSYGSSDPQSHSTGQTTPTQEWSDSTTASYFATEISNLEPHSNGQTTPPLSQERVNSVASYTQSLVLDQRGNASRQQAQPDNQFPSRDREEPTTYAEYLQQRQEESTATT